MNATKMKTSLLTPLLILLFTACAIPYETATSSRTVVRVHYANPAWAPAYHAGVRYYYFPDIEVYYDLQNGDFVYLNDGRWFFSNVLPPYYGDFDLYHGYLVSLNINVYQPWRHHHYYVANYPRYYYRNYYHNDRDCDGIRGFNENDRHPIYRPDYRRDEHSGDRGRRPSYGNDTDGRRNPGYDSDRRRSSDNATDNKRWDNNDNRTSRYNNDGNRSGQGNYSGGGRSANESTVSTPPSNPQPPAANRDDNNGGRSSRFSREPQETNYYGRNIGRPVPVERQMREPKPSKSESHNGESRSSGGRR